MIHIRRFCKSVQHAVRGIGVVFQNEQSFRLQMVSAILVIFFAAWFGVKTTEWIVLLLLIGLVLSLEMMNSILERIVDSFKPRIHPIVRDIKDIMAGTVFVASCTSAIVGIVIFWPYIEKLVNELS